jgi:hypothetical protein
MTQKWKELLIVLPFMLAVYLTMTLVFLRDLPGQSRGSLAFVIALVWGQVYQLVLQVRHLRRRLDAGDVSHDGA